MSLTCFLSLSHLPLYLLRFFSHSARKRMSVIMRTPSGKIRLYCKGAVSVCLSPWQRMTAHHHQCRKHKCWKLSSPCCLLFLSGNLYSEQQRKATSSYFTRGYQKNCNIVDSKANNIFWCNFNDWAICCSVFRLIILGLPGVRLIKA